MMCDKHVVKMILESAQMLCAAFPDGLAPYGKTHINHPCTIWTRTSISNFEWLVDHAEALCKEYTFRYGKIHRSQEIIEWCKNNKKLANLPNIGLTKFALAMPEDCKLNNPVLSYRNYYLIHKRKFAKWNKGRNPPYWWKVG